MDLNKQLEFCKKCQNRKFDSKSGVICSLTNEKPEFVNECPHFIEDKKVTEKKQGRAEMRSRMKKGNSKGKSIPAWRILLFMVLIIYALIRIGGRIAKSYNQTNRPTENINSNTISNSLNKQSNQSGLSKSDIQSLSGEYSLAKNISLSEKIEISLPKGYYLFPKFHNDTIPLIAYANNYLLTCEKYKIEPDISLSSQWFASQSQFKNGFPLLPYFPMVAIPERDSSALSTLWKIDFEYIHESGLRYGHTKMIESKGYRYYITLSGSKKDYKILRRYLNNYLLVRK